MSNDIFSGLEDLGFDDIDIVDLYEKEEDRVKNTEEVLEQSEEEKQKPLLYDIQVTCPVCDITFKARAVKNNIARTLDKESDGFIRYGVINPYFYDVWVCNHCGYSSIKSDFQKIRGYQIEAVKQKITPKWRKKKYPEIYNIDIAIERYKLSLLNFVVTDAKSSKKAMNCLKLAWMYRLKEDTENELIFLNQAADGFNKAYFDEEFPIYQMNKFSIMYLIGELNRRIGKTDEAMTWFSRVITLPGAPQKLKDKTRDQRDLMAEELKNAAELETAAEECTSSAEKGKKGFFSKFFK